MPATKRKPLVAVLDWKTAPASNSGVDLEAKVLGQGVRTKYYLIDTEADFTPEILGADALIVWQNTLITERTLDRLKRCRALIRNGVGFDSVDIAAAAADLASARRLAAVTVLAVTAVAAAARAVEAASTPLTLRGLVASCSGRVAG